MHNTILCFIFIHVFISGASFDSVFALKGLLTRIQHSLGDGHYEQLSKPFIVI